jgi:hypothetical protein
MNNVQKHNTRYCVLPLHHILKPRKTKQKWVDSGCFLKDFSNNAKHLNESCALKFRLFNKLNICISNPLTSEGQNAAYITS